MRNIWCWSFLGNLPTANHWMPYGRTFSATGGKLTMAGGTSCSGAPNATARRGSSMPGIIITASGVSLAAGALALRISRPWATDGTARRVASKSCVSGSSGERAALCRSGREVCTRGRTSVFWRCWSTTRVCAAKGRVTLENSDQSSIAPIYGGNVEIDLRSLEGGRFVDGKASVVLGHLSRTSFRDAAALRRVSAPKRSPAVTETAGIGQ
jgi:hypothetical protein